MSPKATAVPNHVGFIMDGNRRWARERGLPTLEGHRRGYANMKRVLQLCMDRGVKVVTVFAFSTENWNRSKREVSYLMNLFSQAVKSELADFQKKNVRLRILGRLQGLPKKLQDQLQHAMEVTKTNTGAVLNMALNYGGRAEIVDAAQRIVQSGVNPAKLTETTFARFLYAGDAPDPDLIVRTSGEQRTSGFLLWEAAYAELYFTPTKWPAFSEKDLDKALEDFAQRKRNFGA